MTQLWVTRVCKQGSGNQARNGFCPRALGACPLLSGAGFPRSGLPSAPAQPNTRHSPRSLSLSLYSPLLLCLSLFLFLSFLPPVEQGKVRTHAYHASSEIAKMQSVSSIGKIFSNPPHPKRPPPHSCSLPTRPVGPPGTGAGHRAHGTAPGALRVGLAPPPSPTPGDGVTPRSRAFSSSRGNGDHCWRRDIWISFLSEDRAGMSIQLGREGMDL